MACPKRASLSCLILLDGYPSAVSRPGHAQCSILERCALQFEGPRTMHAACDAPPGFVGSVHRTQYAARCGPAGVCDATVLTHALDMGPKAAPEAAAVSQSVDPTALRPLHVASV